MELRRSVIQGYDDVLIIEYIHFSMNLTAIFTSMAQKKRKEKIGINDIA